MCDIGDIVLPGDKIDNFVQSKGKVLLGPGLQRDGEEVIAVRPGIFKYREPNIYWIESHQKRYVPSKDEDVIGVVTNAKGELFKVDIGSSEQASLSYLNFEGATKRNRPDVKNGDLVYAKLSIADKHAECELTCVDRDGKSKGKGCLPDGGFMFQVPLHLAHKLRHPDCPLLKYIGKETAMEVIAAMNGRVWIKSRSARETIAIANAISAAEFLNYDKMKDFVDNFMNELYLGSS
ncbi:DgyrCDS1532 [Dimorphilus gyrociliatus]|uniref:Ribosomal RNA-processing protein 40 n=1 Tax=Dimorphilus gyrociliatus TaxID=2664684 RepID=A0A7I8VAH9_9ANNE|nr:DgyrCDS1532 [Dimorphilus gyrociliatus]